MKVIRDEDSGFGMNGGPNFTRPIVDYSSE